jgi:hypothetical protein
MPNEIDGVQPITVGRDRGESEYGFTQAPIVELADEGVLARYLRPDPRANGRESLWETTAARAW